MIRSANGDDALSAFRIQRSVVAENDYMITTPQEFQKTEESFLHLIQKTSDNTKELFLVAEVEGEVAGWLIFHTPSLQRRAHIGEFGMMLEHKWRGRGLGKLLISAMLDWAAAHPVIEKIGLEVFSTNEKAIRLYSGMGFKEEGRRVKQIKFGGDRYADLVLMYKMVK